MRACSRGKIPAASRGRSSARRSGAGGARPTRSARRCRCSRSTSIERARRCRRVNVGGCRRRRTSCGGCSNELPLAGAEATHHLPELVVDLAPALRGGRRRAPGEPRRTSSGRPRAANGRRKARAVPLVGRDAAHEGRVCLGCPGRGPLRRVCPGYDVGSAAQLRAGLRVPCADIMLDTRPSLRWSIASARRFGATRAPATPDASGKRRRFDANSWAAVTR
jgi:hypothetical protein